jgi:hypothetical protein
MKKETVKMTDYDKQEIKRLEQLLEQRETELSQAKRAYEKTEISRQFERAMTKANVPHRAWEDVLERVHRANEWKLDSRGRMFRELPTGGPSVKVTGDYYTADEFIESLKGIAPHLTEASPVTQQGAGTGVGGKNPWSKDSWNMTEQGKIFRENPERAQRLAAEAGVELPIDTGRKR